MPFKRDKQEFVDDAGLEVPNTGDHDNIIALAATYTPGSEEERRLVRKIDRRLVPCIWGLYSGSIWRGIVSRSAD